MSDQDNWSCAADFLDEIEVDKNGKCKWTDVANAQTHIRMALRCAQSEEITKLRNQLVRKNEALKQIAEFDDIYDHGDAYVFRDIARAALTDEERQ